VTIEADTPRSVRLGVAYYFCSRECKREFDGNAEKYVPR
jgi:YHS domain-containing protein